MRLAWGDKQEVKVDNEPSRCGVLGAFQAVKLGVQRAVVI